MPDLDRIYDLLQRQGETLARIDQSQQDTHERLFGGGGSKGSIPYLYEEVTKHSRQITFFRGVLAVLAFLWTAGVAFASVVLGRHR